MSDSFLPKMKGRGKLYSSFEVSRPRPKFDLRLCRGQLNGLNAHASNPASGDGVINPKHKGRANHRDEHAVEIEAGDARHAERTK